MSLRILVAYDGSPSAGRALDFAVARARAIGGSIVLAHVLEWSPYSFLTPTEIEERHARRKEELDRAETALLAPQVRRLRDEDVTVETVIRYGHIAETLCDIAQQKQADMIMVGRMGQSRLASRLFGSVAGSLAQIAPVPVTIVP